MQKATRSSELLGLGEDELDGYMKNLIIQPKDEAAESEGPVMRVIVPEPGFCVKLKSADEKKVFINVCQSLNIPTPRPISDTELLSLLDSDDPSGFRIHMSLGEAHEEKDNHGLVCTAYDVVVSREFLTTLQTRELMKNFFLTVVVEGLEDKYNISLDRNWTVLKNRKFLGYIPEQNIRTKSKPLILEMNSTSNSSNQSTNAVTNKSTGASDRTQNKNAQAAEKKKKEEEDERNKSIPEPQYKMIQEPIEGHPEYIVAEIQLPLIKSAASLSLDIGEDRLLLETRSQVYRLDIYLPYNLIQDETVSQFNRKTKILTVTMPVQPLQTSSS